MRTSTRIGIIGSSFAVAGSAALAALAPSAVASSGYNSTAKASSGTVNVGGDAVPAASASATPSNSPQADAVPSSDLTSELQGGLSGVPGLGDATLNGSDIVAVEATANSGGDSSACAAVLASNCDGGGTPIVLTYDINNLLGSLTGTGGGLLPLPGALKNGGSLVVTINGPKASCSAGQNGSGLTASDDSGTASGQLLTTKGHPIGGPITLASGDILSQIGPLQKVLSEVGSSTGLNLTLGAGSASKSGGAATATAGEVGLTAAGTTVLDVKGATATCGPNEAAGSSGGGSGSGSGGSGGQGGSGGSGGSGTTGATGPAGTSIPTSTSTSGETALGGGIQTDEGRSPSSTPGWLALNGNP